MTGTLRQPLSADERDTFQAMAPGRKMVEPDGLDTP